MKKPVKWLLNIVLTQYNGLVIVWHDNCIILICMSKEKIDRNSKKEINTDIDFINGILKYLKDKDYVSVEVCLTDWKKELEDLVKKS